MDMAGVRRVSPSRNEDLKNELKDIYSNLAHLNEVDWSKVRDIVFNDARTARRAAFEKIDNAYCLECPEFLEHVLCYPTYVNCSMQLSTKSILSDKRLRNFEI